MRKGYLSETGDRNSNL